MTKKKRGHEVLFTKQNKGEKREKCVLTALLCFALFWFGLVWVGLVWFGLVWFGLGWLVLFGLR
jgi:hypothetical protein